VCDAKTMKIKIYVLVIALLQMFLHISMHAQPMKTYTIDFPKHVFRFGIPMEIAKGIWPTDIDQKFDPFDAAYLRDGFRRIGSSLYDFKGPFWKDAYGSLKINFIVQKRSPKFQSEIVTLDGLDRYIRWWTQDVNPSYPFNFGRAVCGNSTWLSRAHSNFSMPNSTETGQREELEVFSIPIDGDMFLDVGFIITEWEPGSANKWRLKAEKLREAIKSTMVLETKSSPDSENPHGAR